jgi:hypothetical protein
VNHLFFDCVVAKQLWAVISRIFGIQLGDSLDSIASFGLAIRKTVSLTLFRQQLVGVFGKSETIYVFRDVDGRVWLCSGTGWQ